MSEFVPFKIAKKLKEKGFKEECLAYYTKDSGFYYNTSYGSDIENAFKSFNSRPNHICGKRIDAPTISQVLKWLRDEKKIHIGVLYHNYYAVWIQPMKRNEAEHVIHDCKTYEEAELEGIEFVLDNLI
jgi:hypothetical protein